MKKKISILLIILLSVISIPVFAEENDQFFADDEVTIEKNVSRTSFAAGNFIRVSSEIDGINFAAGNNITVSSKQDYMFIAGNSINIENATAKDAFIAGSMVNIQSSTIRDLYVAGATVRIDSDLSGKAYIAADSVTINSKIEGDVEVAADKIRIGKEAVINGTLKYPKDADLNISETATVNSKKSYKSMEYVKFTITKEAALKAKIIANLYAFFAMLIIGFIFLSISKKFFGRVADLDKTAGTIAKQCLTGLVFLIVLPISAIIIMLTLVGIPLSIVSLLLYGILIYLSVLPTAYYLGKFAFKDKIKNDYLLLLVSLLIIYVLKMIPVIGTIVGLISLLFGLGAYFNLLIRNKNEKE